jgi:hypothetical protein
MKTVFRRYEDNIIVELGGRRGDRAALAAMVSRRSADWRYIAAASDAHNITARLYSKALDLPLPDTMKKRIAAAAKNAIVHAIHDQKVKHAELSRILAVLSARGIPCMLIKGLAIDRSMVRVSGDIDLLVKPDTLIDAVEALLQLPGYRFRKPAPGDDGDEWRLSGRLAEGDKVRIRRLMPVTHEFQLFNTELGILVELHINLFFRRGKGFERFENIDGFLDGIGRVWDSCRQDPELGCMVPSPEHSLLLMCMHNALKRSPSNNRFRLSTVVDIDGLATADIDWTAFLEDCRRFDVVPFAYFSLRLARRLMKTPLPAFVLADLKSGCREFQLMAIRFHLRCVGSLRTGSYLYRGLYQSIGPFAFGGSGIAKLAGALFLPLWLSPLRKLSSIRYSRGSSLHFLLRLLFDPFSSLIRAAKPSSRSARR